MLIVDLVLIVILLALTARGWKIGAIETLGELLGAVLAYMVARAFSPWLGGILGFLMPGRGGLAQFLAFVIIAVLVAKLIGTLFYWAAKLLRIVTRLPFIHLADEIIGAILGLLSGIVTIGSITYLVLFYRLDPSLMSWLGGSSVAQWCESIFSNVLRFML